MNDRKPPPGADLLREDLSPEEYAWVERYIGYADIALNMEPVRRREVNMQPRNSADWRRTLKDLMQLEPERRRAA